MKSVVKLAVFFVAALIFGALVTSVMAANCDLTTGAGCSVALAGGNPKADLICTPLKVGPNMTLACMPRAAAEDYRVGASNPDRIFWKPTTDAWWKD